MNARMIIDMLFDEINEYFSPFESFHSNKLIGVVLIAEDV